MVVWGSKTAVEVNWMRREEQILGRIKMRSLLVNLLRIRYLAYGCTALSGCHGGRSTVAVTITAAGALPLRKLNDLSSNLQL